MGFLIISFLLTQKLPTILEITVERPQGWQGKLFIAINNQLAATSSFITLNTQHATTFACQLSFHSPFPRTLA